MDRETINVLWPDFIKLYAPEIMQHLRTLTFGRPEKWEVKTAYLRGDDKVTIFFRGEIIGYAKIDYSEPCLNFIPK